MSSNSNNLIAMDQSDSSKSSVKKLYNEQVRDLAMNIPLLGRLKNPDFSFTARSRICGSTVNVTLNISDDKIVDFRQTVRACLLGSCSASIFSQNVIGASYDEILSLKDQVNTMLLTGRNITSEKWAEYKILSAAQMEKSRHAAILLVIEATLKAIEN